MSLGLDPGKAGAYERALWISCDEQLPPTDNWVLGWNAAAKGAWIYSYRRSKREWFSHSGTNFHQKITHWRPLPGGPHD